MYLNAYGLTRVQRERLVQMAKSGLYYERYLSNKFNITDNAVRDICARMGNYRCKWLDDKLQHHDGYDREVEGIECLPQTDNQQIHQTDKDPSGD